MIPRNELRLLRGTIREAWALGECGRPAEGYALLDAGLLWAETPPTKADLAEHEPPEPWSKDLADLYRGALKRYSEVFGTPILTLSGSLPTPSRTRDCGPS